jgi:hypothetical protein
VIDDQELDIHSPSFEEAVGLLQSSVETTVSKGPLRVSITIEGETSTYTITLDDDMNVLDLDRRLRSETATS